MKKDKFLELMNEIDDELLESATAEPKKKKSPIIKIALVAAVIAVISVISIIAFVMMNRNQNNEIIGNTDTEEPKLSETVGNTQQAVVEQVTQAPTEDDIYWKDTRQRNGKTYLNQEFAIEWPWNCQAIYNQYTTLYLNGVEYNSRSSYSGVSINSNVIGQKIGDFVCAGYDYMTDEIRSISCSAYVINGVDSSRIIAVKYEGHDGYYPFKPATSLGPQAPSTLGALIDSLDLTNNVALNDFYYEQEDGDIHYGLSDENSAGIWKIIQKYADVKTDLKYENPWKRKVLSFAITSETLGINNLSFSFNQEGYLMTNIEDYGYYYNIGVDAVNEIVDYALKHRIAPRQEEKQYLVGTVTEIGENYIKVDDSVVMKNPEEGIEFTVFADHMNIKRYIISGVLKVGQTVQITHGYLPKDSYTQIKDATDLHVCIITSAGQVLIPE